MLLCTLRPLIFCGTLYSNDVFTLYFVMMSYNSDVNIWLMLAEPGQLQWLMNEGETLILITKHSQHAANT